MNDERTYVLECARRLAYLWRDREKVFGPERIVHDPLDAAARLADEEAAMAYARELALASHELVGAVEALDVAERAYIIVAALTSHAGHTGPRDRLCALCPPAQGQLEPQEAPG